MGSSGCRMVACKRSETSCGCAKVDKYARFCQTVSAFPVYQHGPKYLVYREALGSDEVLGSLHHILLRPSTRPAQPLLLQHSDHLIANGRAVAVLVIRRATRIAEYYSVL